LSGRDGVFVVFNPRSGKGRGARLVEPLLAALKRAGVAEVEHALTASAGDEARLAAEAAGRGFGRIVAVGGDGTWGNAANGILRAGGQAALGIVPGGTGCDLAKSLGVPTDLDGCARIVAAGHTRAIDAGTVEGKYFLNVVGFGFDIAVLEDTWRVKRLSGQALYLYCAVRQLYRFPGFPVEMAVDGEEPRRREMLMLVIANGRIFGGGFRIAPGADVADGRLDAVAFGNMAWTRRFPLMLHLMRGTHGTTPEVSTAQASRFVLRFQAPPAYETDGEWNQAQASELVVGTAPGALRVLVPPAS
jgi:diacylglycerol kinase (ATP)